jgi:ferredoxin-NADP reductase
MERAADMAHRLLMECKVSNVEEVAPDITLFQIAPLKRQLMPVFRAGAHINIRLHGIGMRSYSICSDPEDLSHYAIAVQREANGRGGSIALHDRFQINERIIVSHPIHTFELVDDAPGHLMISGGIGITPFLPMLAILQKRKIPHYLHAGVRELANLRRLPTLSKAEASGNVSLYGPGTSHPGLMDIEAILKSVASGWHVYGCGPGPMMDLMRQVGAHLDDRLHFEHFKGLDAGQASKGEPFDIFVPTRKLTIHVRSDQTAAAALNEANVPVQTSCGGGVCRTCVVHYRSGDPIHRDRILSPKARENEIALCVSRARGLLTLEL